MKRSSKEANFDEAIERIFKCFNGIDTPYTVFDDPKVESADEKSNFWLMGAALKQFFDKNQRLPVAGPLPDMTSTTEFYLGLLKVYQDRAAADKEQFKQILAEILQQRGVPADQVTEEEIEIYCKNVANIEVTKLKPFYEEIKDDADFSELQNEFWDDESLISWYLGYRATEIYRERNGGAYPQPGNWEALNQIYTELADKMKPEGA